MCPLGLGQGDTTPAMQSAPAQWHALWPSGIRFVMESAQVVLPCDDLETTIAWFTDTCGFRLHMITPADDPAVAVLHGHGMQIYLDRSQPAGHTKLRLPSAGDGETHVAPNGTVVEFVAASTGLELPDNDPVFVHEPAGDAAWVTGRAGMAYRDLLPQRQGGRFIASHISIDDGGPVADYVHHHHVRFQMIFCHRGSARLVYEDQGEPFTFEAGDCVLQPPHIRHQVLETSDAFEVVEIGCPAEHDTLRDHDMELPTAAVARDREFGGQTFVWHRAATAQWQRWRHDDFDYAPFGIADATNGLAHVGLVRPAEARSVTLEPADEFLFWFVRSGTATLTSGADTHTIAARDGVTLAAGEQYELSDMRGDFELLEVRIP